MNFQKINVYTRNVTKNVLASLYTEEYIWEFVGQLSHKCHWI